MTPAFSDYRRNHILNSLSQADLALLSPSLKVVALKQGMVLKEIGDEVEHAYFPHNGVVASRITAVAFCKPVTASHALFSMIVNYNETFLTQVQATAACNALHRLDARLARCILRTRDRVDGDDLPLTQDLLSEMLGVRRSSVSETAGDLQGRGVIRYSRGKMVIIDRPALEEVACECYAMIKNRSALAVS
jgi:CRP-like cAMP-binding protein